MPERMIVITQGEHRASQDPLTVISTLLGSCVACCLHDPVAQVGGMNHILIARNIKSQDRFELAGSNAMELVINAMLKLGARRARLQAKVFGGAQMVSGLSGIGQANADFVLRYLQNEGITCLSQSLGGTRARHLMFWPGSGIVRQRMTSEAEVQKPAAPPKGSGVELF